MLPDPIEESVHVEDGQVAIPDGPGLGITVRESFREQYGQGQRA